MLDLDESRGGIVCWNWGGNRKTSLLGFLAGKWGYQLRMKLIILKEGEPMERRGAGN